MNFLEILKKAWKETYCPLSIRSYFSNENNPSFWEYFVGVPAAQLYRFHRVLYYISLGFIFYPLKNLVKMIIEFPIVFICEALNNLHASIALDHRLFREFVSLLAFGFSVIKNVIVALTSPFVTVTKIWEQTGSVIWANVYYFANLIMLLTLTYFLLPVILAPLIVQSGAFWSGFLNDVIDGGPHIFMLFFVVNVLRSNDEQSLQIERQHLTEEDNPQAALRRVAELEELASYTQFSGYNPNTTICAISMKPLGFTAAENKEAVVKWGDAYCLLSALPEKIRKNPALYKVVPKCLVNKLEENEQCMIALEPMQLKNARRSPYGQYLLDTSVNALFGNKIEVKCPVSRRLLTKKSILPANFTQENHLSQEQLQELGVLKSVSAQQTNISSFPSAFFCHLPVSNNAQHEEEPVQTQENLSIYR